MLVFFRKREKSKKNNVTSNALFVFFMFGRNFQIRHIWRIKVLSKGARWNQKFVRSDFSLFFIVGRESGHNVIIMWSFYKLFESQKHRDCYSFTMVTF